MLNKDEVKRVRKDRISQFEKLVRASDASERGYYLFQLGLTYRDQGEEAKARQALTDAKALGPERLGAELYRSVVEALH